jgi:hypothetical protein
LDLIHKNLLRGSLNKRASEGNAGGSGNFQKLDDLKTLGAGEGSTQNNIEQDPFILTGEVLSMCNAVRAKHAKVNQVYRSSGRGGQGPIPLSPSNSVGNNSRGATFYVVPSTAGGQTRSSKYGVGSQQASKRVTHSGGGFINVISGDGEDE